jgi:hypothetical protein
MKLGRDIKSKSRQTSRKNTALAPPQAPAGVAGSDIGLHAQLYLRPDGTAIDDSIAPAQQPRSRLPAGVVATQVRSQSKDCDQRPLADAISRHTGFWGHKRSAMPRQLTERSVPQAPARGCCVLVHRTVNSCCSGLSGVQGPRDQSGYRSGSSGARSQLAQSA